MRTTNEDWIEQCNIIDKGMVEGNSKKTYETLKALTNTNQAVIEDVEDSSGSLPN